MTSLGFTFLPWKEKDYLVALRALEIEVSDPAWVRNSGQCPALGRVGGDRGWRRL